MAMSKGEWQLAGAGAVKKSATATTTAPLPSHVVLVADVGECWMYKVDKDEARMMMSRGKT